MAARTSIALFYSVAVASSCGDAAGPSGVPAIVFDWLKDENRDIYRSGVNGRDTVRITSDPGDDQQPSAGGGVIVFTTYRDGNAEIYSVAVNGGPARRITSTLANETEPALSRDGSRLAFISDASGTPKLWTALADGNEGRRVTESFGFPGSAEVSPSWSPDGDRVVFVATNSGTADLFIVTPGGMPEQLVAGPTADVEPAWSPDGGEVAFVSDRDGDVELYVVSVRTGDVRRLTSRPGIDAQPSWLPDGRLVFTAWVDGVPRLRLLDPRAPEQPSDVSLNPTLGVAQHAAAIP